MFTHNTGVFCSLNSGIRQNSSNHTLLCIHDNRQRVCRIIGYGSLYNKTLGFRSSNILLYALFHHVYWD